LVSFLGTSGIFFGSLYSIWLYNRLCFGNLKIQYNSVYIDVSRREFYIFIPFIFMILLLGITPSFFLDYFYSSSFLICN
jgi:NADH-quinone oxidoreductase subunit M